MIRSLDTNIVVRLITQDDPRQYEIAKAIVQDPVLVLSTVILEAAWVLESAFNFEAPFVACQLIDFLAMPTVQASDRSALLWALARFGEDGADLPDALHLALSSKADCFTTFDRTIAKHADNSVVPVETLR